MISASSPSILIIGASGSVGSCLYSYLTKYYSSVWGTFNLTPKDNLIELDTTNYASVSNILSELRPDIIIYVAGNKNIPFCQENPVNALSANAYPVKLISEASEKLQINPFLIFISTDYVFSGEKHSYTYQDKCKPNTAYGFSKLVGESLCLSLFSKSSLVLRSSAIMTQGSGFFGWLNNSLSSGQKIDVFDNVYFSPTSAIEFCSHIADIISNKERLASAAPISHFSSGVSISRHEFAVILAQYRYPKSLHLITPVKCEFNDSLFSPNLALCSEHEKSLRPKDSLDISNFFES